MIVQVRKQALDAGATGTALDIGQLEPAQARRINGVAGAGFLQRKVGQPNVQVALDGPQVDAELLGQGARVERLALIELKKDP